MLTGAALPDCRPMTLHRSVVRNIIARMIAHGVAVPSHGAVTFWPGGYHPTGTRRSTGILPGKQAPITPTVQKIALLRTNFEGSGAKGDERVIANRGATVATPNQRHTARSIFSHHPGDWCWSISLRKSSVVPTTSGFCVAIELTNNRALPSWSNT